MKLVFFSHPTFLGSQSMPRYTAMLANGMKQRGHKVEVWSPEARFVKTPAPAKAKKWLGYVDQYVLFPQQVRRRMRDLPADTLFVYTDHALGPWVPLAKDRPHVVHCHDFLAQRSAKGEINQNPTGWTGRQYQAYIRRGYATGRHFVSVSRKTKEDLHLFLPSKPVSSAVAYNGINPLYKPCDPQEARKTIGSRIKIDTTRGYLLHVGGNQWYKNRKGVVEIYDAWRASTPECLPLLLVGQKPNEQLLQQYGQSPYKADIHFVTGLTDEDVRLAYAGASVFLFPSLAEGFGWPIAEAMASGCPVITTGEAPMTEVAGKAAFLIEKRPLTEEAAKTWAAGAASVVNRVVNLAAEEINIVTNAGLRNAARFDIDPVLDEIEKIYRDVLRHYTTN